MSKKEECLDCKKLFSLATLNKYNGICGRCYKKRAKEDDKGVSDEITNGMNEWVELGKLIRKYSVHDSDAMNIVECYDDVTRELEKNPESVLTLSTNMFDKFCERYSVYIGNSDEKDVYSNKVKNHKSKWDKFRNSHWFAKVGKT